MTSERRPTGSPVARSHTRTERSALPDTATGRPVEIADCDRVYRPSMTVEDQGRDSRTQ